MIKDKVIYFGYGDILVGHNYFNSNLELELIKPPMEIGSSPKSDSYEVLETIHLRVTEEHLAMLRKVNKKDGLRSFKVGEYTLDFSNYNPKSVVVVEEHMFAAVYGVSLICLAC